MQNKVSFTVPVKILNVCKADEEMNMYMKGNSKYDSHVVWRHGKLRLSKELAVSQFDKSLKKIRGHLQELIINPNVKEVTAILMVGGYSECPLLQDTVKGLFPAKKIIIPHEAGLAVLKGAVITGHCQGAIITERICRFTYGVRCIRPFKVGVHKEEYKTKNDKGEARCKNLFQVHVAVGDRIKVGEASTPKPYGLFSPKATGITVDVFASSDRAPIYTKEKTCQKLGQLKIEMPDTARGKDRGVNVCMKLGGTEIGVEAIDKHTMEKHTAFFDFLG